MCVVYLARGKWTYTSVANAQVVPSHGDSERMLMGELSVFTRLCFYFTVQLQFCSISNAKRGRRFERINGEKALDAVCLD